MYYKRCLLPLLIAAVIIFPSCHHVPKHLRFVPRDAMVVLGVHTAEMKKELTWSAITGSNLLEELQKSGAGDRAPAAIRDLENSGIDFSNTLYFYTKPDSRFGDGTKMAAVLPIADPGKLNSYIQRHFPGVPVHETSGRSELMLDKKFCISWNDEVAIVMNSIVQKVQHSERSHIDTLGRGNDLSAKDGVSVPIDSFSWTEEISDSVATFSAMAEAFQPTKGSGINEVDHFVALEKANHDITFWVNYDAMMDLVSSRDNGMGMMGGTIGNTMFKGSAMASGFDFEKGRVNGLMRYYASDSMKPVAREFGKEMVDGDMLRRLPAPGLNLAAGYHLSPAVIKMMLEKLNLSGMANLALMSQGITIDDALGGFTGDMVFAINNFHLERKAQEIDSAIQSEYGLTPYTVTKPAADFVFALKIGDKAKLGKLMALFSKSGMLQQTAPNTYSIQSAASACSLVLGDKYIAASTSPASAQAFLKEHAGAMPDAVHQEISGHPFGIWADIHSFLQGSAVAGGSASDSAALAIVRNTFTTFSLNGGEVKNAANEYRMTMGFVNKDENSLIQLLHLAQQLTATKAKNEAVSSR
jgi:hypothetical protein